MERVTTQLSELTTAKTAALVTAGINNGEDLSAITFDDITLTLGTATIMKRRKLLHIGTPSTYLARGQVVNEATTIPMIINHINTPVAPVVNNPAPQANPPPPSDHRR